MGKLKKLFISLLILAMTIVPVFANEVDQVYFGMPLINQTSKNVNFQVMPLSRAVYGQTKKTNVSNHLVRSVYGNNLNDYDLQTPGEFSELIWPDVKVTSITPGDDFDRDLANEVMSEAVSSLNEILYFYYDWQQIPGESGNDVKTDISNILTSIERANGNLSGSYYDLSSQIRIYSYWSFLSTYQNSVPNAVKQAQKQIDNAVKSANVSNSKLRGTTRDDFVIITTKYDDGQNGNLLREYEWFKVVQWSFPKGYYDGQVSPGSDGKNVAGNTKINLSQVAHYANLAYKKSGITVENKGFASVASTSSTEDTMNRLFGSNWLNGIWTSVLGFEKPNELILNTKSSAYYLGLMPKSWWNITGNLFWVAEIIAVVILIMSVIYTTMKQSAATFSPTVRNSIKDSLMNTIFAIMLIIAYPAIFYILAKINIMIVETCASFNFTPITLTTGGVASPGIMGSIISMLFTFVNLGLILKLNVDYLTRSIMIAILHIIAPAAIATISIGGTSRSLFSRWLKELVSAIYMQGFDAILLTILCMVLSSGYAGKWWWNQVFIFIIASLNSWFKTSIIGLSDSVRESAKAGYGFTDKLASTAENVTKGASMMAVGGALGAAGAAGGAAAGGAAAETAAETGFKETMAAAKGGAGGPGGLGGGSSLESGSGSFENEVSKKTPTVNKTDTGQKPVKQSNPNPVTQNNTSGDNNQIPTEKVTPNESLVNENSKENSELANVKQTDTSKDSPEAKEEEKTLWEKVQETKTYKAVARTTSGVVHNQTFQNGAKIAAGSILEMGSTNKDGLGSRMKDNGYRNATKAIFGGDDNPKDQYVPRTEKETDSYPSNFSNNTTDTNDDEEILENKNKKKKDEDEVNRRIDEQNKQNLELQEEFDSKSGDGSVNT